MTHSVSPSLQQIFDFTYPFFKMFSGIFPNDPQHPTSNIFYCYSPPNPPFDPSPPRTTLHKNFNRTVSFISGGIFNIFEGMMLTNLYSLLKTETDKIDLENTKLSRHSSSYKQVSLDRNIEKLILDWIPWLQMLNNAFLKHPFWMDVIILYNVFSLLWEVLSTLGISCWYLQCRGGCSVPWG